MTVTIVYTSSLPRAPSMLQIVPLGSKERLAFLARQMDVDILVSGHSHEFKVQYSADYHKINICLSVLLFLPV